MIRAINPCGKKTLVEPVTSVSSNITCVAAVGHNIHLHQPEQALELALHLVLLNLPKGIHEGVILILQLNLYHGHTINQQGDIKAAFPVTTALFS